MRSWDRLRVLAGTCKDEWAVAEMGKAVGVAALVTPQPAESGATPFPQGCSHP